MRKTVLNLSVIFSIFALFALSACGGGSGSKYSDPVEYNDAIIDEIDNVYSYVVQLDSLAGEDEFNYDNYEKVRKEALQKIEEAKKNIEQIGDLDGDPMLKDAAINYLNQTKEVVDNEWKEIGVKMKDFEKLSDDEFDKLFDLIEKAYEKDYDMLDEIDSIQQKFADKHGYQVQ